MQVSAARSSQPCPIHETFVAWPPNNEGNQQQHQAANDQWLRYKQQEQAENLEHPTTISDNNLHLISV